MSTTDQPLSPPTNVARRHAERGSTDRDKIYEVLDRNYVGQLGVIDQGWPLVLPMMYVRVADAIYVHGAAGNHLIKIANDAPCCFSVTEFSELVLAPIIFNHSMNYASVSIYGVGEAVVDLEEKSQILSEMIESLYPTRSTQLRKATTTELRSTSLLRLGLDYASVKVRTGPPASNDEPITGWVGTVSLERSIGGLSPIPGLPSDIAEPTFAPKLSDRRVSNI